MIMIMINLKEQMKNSPKSKSYIMFHLDIQESSETVTRLLKSCLFVSDISIASEMSVTFHSFSIQIT